MPQNTEFDCLYSIEHKMTMITWLGSQRLMRLHLKSIKLTTNEIAFKIYKVFIARWCFCNSAHSQHSAHSYIESVPRLVCMTFPCQSVWTKNNPSNVLTLERTTYSQFLKQMLFLNFGRSVTMRMSFNIPCNLCQVEDVLMLTGNNLTFKWFLDIT
jgi:hypothetical protein